MSGGLLSRRELEVMQLLWEFGPSTAMEIQSRFDHRLAYTTVATVLRVLDAKRHVTHTEHQRTFRYHPLLSREQVITASIRYLRRKMFRNSSVAMLRLILAEPECRDTALLRRVRRALGVARAARVIQGIR
jgi:predicted transcriptional regulator